METIYQQIILLITTNPGNILYHLVVAFSILGTTQAALNLWRQETFPQSRRMVIGLVLLLVLRLLLSLAAVLCLIGTLDPHILLPNTERAMMTLSLIIILWLWVYPEPTRLADAASGLLSILTLILFFLFQGWWSTNSLDLTFNNTFAATSWEILALVLLTVGILLLILRKPNGWGYGLGMAITLSIGQFLQLFFPATNSDFPGAARLFEMAAYPLLWTLPHRFNLPKGKAEPTALASVEAENDFPASARAIGPLDEELGIIQPELFRDILMLADTTTTQTIEEKFTKLMAKTMRASICFLIQPADPHGTIQIPCAYDMTQQRYLSSRTLESQKVPLLVTAMKRSRPLRLPASSTSQDKLHITRVLELKHPGHILAAFVPAEEDGPSQIGILLVSSDYKHRWNRDDQAFLNTIAATMAPILQQPQHLESIPQAVEKARQDIESRQTLFKETDIKPGVLQEEIEGSSYQVNPMQEIEKHQLLEKLSESQAIIDKLKMENLTLQTKVKNLSETIKEQAKEPQHLREELKLALTEIAQLRNRFIDVEYPGPEEIDRTGAAAVSQSKAQRSALEDHARGLSVKQISSFTSIIHDLHQPMSSIVGYTDLLLAESAGILGAVQRKFLERIKVSIHRMEIFLEDLLQIVSQDTVSFSLTSEKVNLERAIDAAIAETQGQFQERGIVLRLDLADEIPEFLADQDALQQILIQLLKNAGTASPVNGEIFLRTSTYREDNNEDYVLIQVADQGGGIPTDDLPKIFSRFYRTETDVIPGIGESAVALSIVKTLVEAHNGRIWVDTELGKGSTLTLLIPLKNGKDNLNQTEEEDSHVGDSSL